MNGQQSPVRTSFSRLLRRFRILLALLIGVAVVLGGYFVYKRVASKAIEASCRQNLKRLGDALHAYHDRHGKFPPAFVRGKDGSPAHSWRVLILPFLGRHDLYDAYRMDEPWDGPNNIGLADQMPDVFACPSGTDREKGKSSYVAVVGSQTMWPGDKAAPLSWATDSTSQTILLIEISNSGIGWTEPRDVRLGEILPPDGDDVSERFGSGHKGTVNKLLVDGSVHSIKHSPSERISRRILYSALTASGGRPFGGKWLPGENEMTSVGDFPTERDATTFRTTDIVPHLADAIKADRNYVYCATFQMAWDDFREFFGGNLQVESRPSLATGLNGPPFPRSSLSSASNVARMGLVRERIRDKIIAEMAEKFPGITPSLSDSVSPDGVIAYAFLQKNLPFAVRFDRISEPLIFHAAAGDTSVTCFGFKELDKATGNVDGLKQQVDVLHYESDDEFVLRLKPTSDEIVLAKIRPAATLGETLRTVQSLIGTGSKKVDRPKLEDKDKLLIPRLGFNVLRDYDELIGKHLENPGKEEWFIAEAKQAVRFLLNESGARLESEMQLGADWNGHPPLPPPPRMFVFDRPFLLYMKEPSAEQPYLVIWVANAELMERRQ
jgi:hypothetical protein